MQLIFKKMRYHLTFEQIQRDAPSELSSVLERCRHKLKVGRTLYVPVRERHCMVFGILFDYLNGACILPLSSSHSMILTNDATPTERAYARLREEADFFSLQRLVRGIDFCLAQLEADKKGDDRSFVSFDAPVEPFSLFCTESLGPIDEDDLLELLEEAGQHQCPLLGLPKMRGTVVDAAIK
jgi:hypothetical protein